MTEITGLPAHSDSCLEVEVQVFVRHDELIQLGHVLQLGVAVEQQCRVVLVGELLLVKRLRRA